MGDDSGPTLYVADFDFDDRLARPELGDPPANLRAINARLAPLLEPLCGPGDAVVLPDDPLNDAVRFVRVEPWGVEPHLLRWLRRSGVRGAARDRLPDPEAVRAANSRRFQFETERDLGLLSPGSRLCETPDDLHAAVAALPDGWVVKREFGGSGRDVRLGTGPLPEPVARWAAKALSRGQCMIVEPHVPHDGELSAHFTLDGNGVTHDGFCRLVSTATGGFAAVEPLTDPGPAVTAALPLWTAAAERVRAVGYRGPLGIDALVRDGAVVRPVMDLNARWTMGRIALLTGEAVTNP